MISRRMSSRCKLFPNMSRIKNFPFLTNKYFLLIKSLLHSILVLRSQMVFIHFFFFATLTVYNYFLQSWLVSHRCFSICGFLTFTKKSRLRKQNSSKCFLFVLVSYFLVNFQCFAIFNPIEASLSASSKSGRKL